MQIGKNGAMGRHSGGKRKDSPSNAHLIKLTSAGVAALATWGVLVWLAIRFATASDRGTSHIAMTLVAGLGATCCLLLTLLVGTRILGALGITQEQPTGERYLGKRSAR